MDDELQIGEVLKTDGREYTVIQFLGRGSSFTAYLAECKCGGFITKCILKQSRSVTDAWRDENDLNAQSHYLRTAQTQHHIRQIAHLMNQTPPVNHTFEVNGKGFIDVAAYNGNTLDKLPDLTLPQYMEICLAAAKTVRYYHEAGFLCLDLKPENIFILQNAPDDTITQLVAFIDFTSVSPAGKSGLNPPSYTKAWAAPEQINPYSAGKIGAAAEIYTLGEIVFWLLFGRHSTEQEHRGFSKYPFDERYLGDPGVDNLGHKKQWHHIVEQCQAKASRSNFDISDINQVSNIMATPKEVHKDISKYYSRIDDFTGGKTVRDWLNGKSFEFQYEFGIEQ